MRTIEIKIKDLGTYKIESENYVSYIESIEEIRRKKSTILNKILPISNEYKGIAGLLDEEEYMYLRSYIPLFETWYTLINTEKKSVIEDHIKEIQKMNDDIIEGISFLII